jgi:cytochrome P450 family 4
MAQHRVANPWLLFGFIYKLTQTAVDELNQKKELDNFTRTMIRKRKKEKADGILSENRSLLDHMIEISENNADFTEEDIINEACTFMLAVSDLLTHCPL